MRSFALLNDAIFLPRRKAARSPPQTIQPSYRSTQVLYNLGHQHLDEGDRAGGEEYYRRAIAIQPDYIQVHSDTTYASARLHRCRVGWGRVLA